MDDSTDILSETRYGDTISLEEDIYDPIAYVSLREKTIAIVEKYFEKNANTKIKAAELFDITDSNYGDCLEQIINASDGNFRRIIQLLDIALIEFLEDLNGDFINKSHVERALKKHSQTHENLFSELDKEFLERIATVCRSRGTYKFQFPYKAPTLFKYTSKSKEFNILNIIEAGSGRKGTTYAFDYSYCINHNIPTHRLQNSERVDRSRSLNSGAWITRTSQITEELIEHAGIPGKIEGELDYINETGDSGFVKGDDGKSYFVNKSFVIDDDRNKSFISGKRVRFFPSSLKGSDAAFAVELI